MKRTRRVDIRLKDEEYLLLKEQAQNTGYTSTSSYARAKLLTIPLEQKMVVIERLLKQLLEKK